MRKAIVITFMLLGLASMAMAQETPKVEIFGGYSLFHWDAQDLASAVPPGTSINQNIHGWNGSLQFNVNKYLGVVADMSGHYGTPISEAGVGDATGSIHNFLFGPQVNIRGKKAKGFVHALFGVNRVSLNDSPAMGFTGFSDNAFGMALGGGADVSVTKMIGIRVGQIDYIMSNHDTGLGHQNNFRFSTGLLFSFGGK